jgi:putative acetyltransferase
VTARAFVLRPYDAASDEEATFELWRRTWQIAYPRIDFTKRLAWWRDRWRNELVPVCTITVIEMSGEIVGFVTVDPSNGYLDQLVVAPEAWGSSAASALMDAAKRIAPTGLDLHVNRDNARAIRFYQKHGFAMSGEEFNSRSGTPIYRMSWRP